jgi:hypothetical protein
MVCDVYTFVLFADTFGDCLKSYVVPSDTSTSTKIMMLQDKITSGIVIPEVKQRHFAKCEKSPSQPIDAIHYVLLCIMYRPSEWHY